MSLDNGVGIKGELFGVAPSLEAAEMILIPVSWDLTTSFHSGTVNGAQAIKDISYQLDLFNPDFPNLVPTDMMMADFNPDLLALNQTLKPQANAIVAHSESDAELTPEILALLETVNQGCQTMVDWVYAESQRWIESDRLLALVGGDHSTSYGLVKALSEVIEDGFGILQIDAHMDLRDTYQGFKYSHASIMKNCLDLSPVSRLVQVGIRDYCEDEYQRMKSSHGRIKTFFDSEIQDHLHEGKSWESLCKKIVNALPDKVYISMDIDGLDPALCPHTGTPVPGGLSFSQLSFLLRQLVKSKRQIIGCDLVEVSPDSAKQWDENVGARVLHLLCGAMWESNQ